MQRYSFHTEYKPFRNFMRQFPIDESLFDIWRYSNYAVDGIRLPTTYYSFRRDSPQGPGEIYSWEFDTLVKEVVLNGQRRGERRLHRKQDLISAMRHIRKLRDVAFAHSEPTPEKALFQLNRIFHQQFPWQSDLGVAPYARALKIFGHADIAAIVEKEHGMSVIDVQRLGAALGGEFIRSPVSNARQDYSDPLKIVRPISEAFIARLTCTIDELRSELVKYASYGPDWEFTWNPLAAKPLIRFDMDRPDMVICPIPRLLQRRVTSGLYYDIVNARGFDIAFGKSFQDYVGDVLTATCRDPRFSIRPETPYSVGKDRKHGVDWILSDAGGHIFIEAKTKRLTISAKTLSEPADLDANLAVMATAVTQNYKNICDAVNGLTSWRPDGNDIYPLILTLDDWFIVSPAVHAMLLDHVKRLLRESNIDESMTEVMPYTIASASEFEVLSQIINQVGIDALMRPKSSAAERQTNLLGFARARFPQEYGQVNWRLFEADFMRLTDGLGHH